MKYSSVSFKVKTIDQYFPVILFTTLYKLGLSFEDELSNESNCAETFIVYYAV